MSLDSLPAEILQKIFDFLPSNEHLEKTRISRRWNQLALRETYHHPGVRRSANFRTPASKNDPRILLLLGGVQLGLRTRAESVRVVRAKVLPPEAHPGRNSVVRDGPVRGRACVLGAKFGPAVGYGLEPDRFERSWDGAGAAPVADAFVDRLTRRAASLGVFAPEVLEQYVPDWVTVFGLLSSVQLDQSVAWDYARLAMPRLKTLEISGCKLNDTSQAFIGNFPNLETLIVQTANENLINLSVFGRTTRDSRSFPKPDGAGHQRAPSRRWNTTKNSTLSAPHLKTGERNRVNLHSFKLTDYSTVKLMISYGPYINFCASAVVRLADGFVFGRAVRQAGLAGYGMHSPVSESHPADDRAASQSQPMGLGGHLMAISFVQLRYLHLRNFDLDYQFLCGINKSSSYG
ncbi:hypothetical protein quinque_016418 [Culex quinquefasciatus]